MTDREPIETTNLDIYGNAPLLWTRARHLLAEALQPGAPDEAHTFLSTVRPDDHPHTAGVGALWHDGDLYVVSGPKTRKSRNLEANPASTIAVSLPGLDLVLEGDAVRVIDRETLEIVADRYRAWEWPVAVEGDAFVAPYSAPSAGPPPWYLYRFTFHTAFGVASAEPHGATRWRFGR